MRPSSFLNRLLAMFSGQETSQPSESTYENVQEEAAPLIRHDRSEYEPEEAPGDAMSIPEEFQKTHASQKTSLA